MLSPSCRRLLWPALLAGCATLLGAQEPAATVHHAQVTAWLAPAQREPAHTASKTPPAVIWLNPLPAAAARPITPGSFTLLQKNKMFTPHLLVVPVGSSVAFPNADPYFHNVFSLFDGRRFDLGLYEAGSSREVTFGREGISYIFCDIHPEMSAVVIALSTPFYGVAGNQGRVHIAHVPAGDYLLHVWAEGEDQA